MNNKLGISTACFYPELTEDCFEQVLDKEIKCCELFLCSEAELEGSFIRELSKKQKEGNVDIVSVHPHLSFAESFYFFSNYERRFNDILPMYRRFFQVCQELNAKYFILHGAKKSASIPDEQIYERYEKIYDMGREYGITMCQENVVYFKSESLEFLKNMRAYLGDKFHLALDIKQARRAFISPYDYISEFHDNISHVHISDYSAHKDCIPPLEGKFDFSELFKELNGYGYDGAYIIELYHDSYAEKKQVFEAYKKTQNLLLNL